jgi:hypothetical protein
MDRVTDRDTDRYTERDRDKDTYMDTDMDMDRDTTTVHCCFVPRISKRLFALRIVYFRAK